MRDVHLLKRIGRELAKALIWTVVLFGPLVAIFVFAAGLPPLGMLVLVGIFSAVMATIVSVLEL